MLGVQNVIASGFEFAHHFMQNHTNLYKVGNFSSSPQHCPMCPFLSVDLDLLQSHFDATHSDEQSFSTQCERNNAETANIANFPCFICDRKFETENQLTDHVNAHFDSDDGLGAVGQSSQLEKSDLVLAIQLQRDEESLKSRLEKEELRRLKEQYGMSDRGSYKSQGRLALERDHERGRIGLDQFYEGLNHLRIEQFVGIEDPNLPLKGLTDFLRKVASLLLGFVELRLCANVEHCSTQPADAGFGCGYRNIQMALTSLKHDGGLRTCLWKDSRCHIPSVPKIQELIEDSWKKGFDSLGAEQLGNKVKGTRKWIGATEYSSLLSSFRIRNQIRDYEKPTDPNGTHPVLFDFVLDYFTRASPTFPIYLQHAGHSRSIVGILVTQNGNKLVVFDPSHRKSRLEELMKQNPETPAQAFSALKLFLKSPKEMKHKQYQLVVVEGSMSSEEEYQETKSKPRVTKIL